MSILLYGCASWALTKRLEKKLDGNYTRMLRGILNKSWRQHPKKHQLYGHLQPPSRKLSKLDEPGTQDTAGGAGTGSYGPSHMDELKQDDQLEHTYSSYVRIRDVARKTCQRWWTVEKSGERESGISVLAARHDDDDDYNLSGHILCVQKSMSVCHCLVQKNNNALTCLGLQLKICIRKRRM